MNYTHILIYINLKWGGVLIGSRIIQFQICELRYFREAWTWKLYAVTRYMHSNLNLTFRMILNWHDNWATCFLLIDHSLSFSLYRYMSSLTNCMIVCQKFKKKRRDLPDSKSHGKNLMICIYFPYFLMPLVCGGIKPRSGRCKYRGVNRWRFATLTLNPLPTLNLRRPTSTLNGDPKFLKRVPLSFYHTLCVYIYVSIWIRAHMRSSTNKIEGRWLQTGREGRGTEVGKEGGRQRTPERDRDRVWRKGGRDGGRERAKARVKRTCTACTLWKRRER